MAKYKLDQFTGHTRVLELEDGATKGATVGENLYYNGVLVLWEDIYNGPANGAPTVGVSAWSLLLDIPPNVTALANQSGTGIYVLTGAGTSAVRDIVSTDGSVTIANPDGVAGDIDLSVPPSSGGVPYFVPDGENYTVPANIQALWKLPITLGVGSSLTVLGALEQVD